MDFLKLPVKYDNSSPEELEKAELMGIEYRPKLERGILYVNPKRISSFNEDTEGDVAISIDGDRWKIFMPFKEFLKKIEEIN